MVSRDDRRNKLHSKWQGPYVITKRDADRKRVDVRHVVDHSGLKNIHDDRVREGLAEDGSVATDTGEGRRVELHSTEE